MYQLEVAADSTSQSEMKRQVAELSSMKKGRNTDGQLRSPYTGVVVNVRADEGDVVSVGTPIYDIRRDDAFSNLIAMVYVSSFDGARIKPGTIMELNPYRDEEDTRGSKIPDKESRENSAQNPMPEAVEPAPAPSMSLPTAGKTSN